MKRVKLSQLAYARSGDKGDGSNVGVVAYMAWTLRSDRRRR